MAKQLNVSLAVTADTSQARAQLQSLQQNLQQLTTSSTNLKLGISSTEIKAASQAALELSAHLKQATNVETGTLNFAKLDSQIRRSGKSISSYAQSLLQLGPNGQQAFNQLTQSIVQSEIPLRRISGLFGNLGTVLQNTVRWQISSSMIHGFMSAVQGAYRYAQDLNKSLNNIQIVTQMNDTQMGKFAVSANKAAKALSTTTTSYTDAALIYYQQGIRDQKEITERTNATIKMANVTGQSAQEVSNQMTAIWNNFADGSQSLEYYADVITALGAATASSSAEISTGLQKFAAVADTVGLSYENATAALATITATTRQSADTVGTGLRTVFSRLQSLSLGETLDDGVTLTKYSKAMQKIGVDVLDASGNLREMDDILIDMGEKWQNLTNAQKTATAQTIGGVRQYTTIMALMDNFDFYKQNLEVAKNSEGTLQKQQEIYEKSWQASTKRVRASAESIYDSLISDEFFIKLNNSFAKFLDFINNIIKGLGGIKGLLGGLGSILLRTFSSSITNKLYQFGAGIADIFTSRKSAAARRDQTISDLAGLRAGGQLDSKGHIIEGSIPQGNQGQYDAYYNQIQYQQNYMRNAAIMTPIQQEMFKMANDQYSQAIQNRIKAEQDLVKATNKLGVSQSNLYDIQRDQANLNPDAWNQFIKNTLDPAIEKQAIYERNLQKIQEGKITSSEISETTIGKKAYEEYLKQIVNNGDDIDFKAIRASLTTAGKKELNSLREQLFEEYSGDRKEFDKAFDEYIQNGFQQGYRKQEEKEAEDEEGAARERAEKTSQTTSRGMQISKSITEMASCLMMAAQAQASLQSVVNTINQMSAGVLSTNDGIIQLSSGITSLGLTGVIAFQSMSKALAGLGAAAGPIAAAITAIMILLPYIIQAIDSLVTTPKELLENLHNNTERAEEAANAAKTAYENLINGFSSHSSLLDTLNELTQGTLEFEQALLSANGAAYDLINKNNLSPEDWYIDNKGAVQIKPEAQERLQQQAINEQRKTQTEALVAKSLEQNEINRQETNKVQKLYEAVISSGEVNKAQQLRELNTLATQAWQARGQERAKGNFEKAKEFELQNQEYMKRYEELQSSALQNFYNWSSIQRYAENNNIPFEQLQQELMTGTFERNQQIRSGAAAQNRLALTNAFLSQSNKTQLSNSESLLIDALSSNSNFLNSVNDASRYVNRIIQKNGSYWGGGYGTTAERLDLSSEAIRDLSIDEMKKLYIENIGGENAYAQLNAILESDVYKAAATKGKGDAVQFLAQSLLTSLTAQNMQKSATEIYSKLPPEVRSKIDNSTQLNAEGITSLILDLTSSGIENTDILAQAVRDNFSRVQTNFIQTVNKAFEDNPEMKAQFAEMAKTWSQEDMELATTLRANYVRAYGEQAGNDILQRIAKAINTGDINTKKALQNFQFSGSTITDLANIRAGMTSFGTYNSQDQSLLATQMYSTIVQSVGEKGLFEELYQSDDFADSLTTLQKEFKKTGKISAQSILEAAKSSEILADWLDISGVGAQGLADTLNALESGAIDHVSEALIRAFGAAGELNNNLAKTYNYIDSFNEERSIQDIGAFYKKRADAVQTGFESGMLLDAPLLQSMDALFGSGLRSKYQQDIYNWTNDNNLTPEEISNKVNEIYAAEIAAMQSIQERGNLSGMFEYYQQQNPNGGMFTYNQTTGQVEAIDIAELQKVGYDSQNAFIQGLQDNYGMSEEMARSMASEYAATNGRIAQLWRQTATTNGLQEFFNDNESNIISADDIRGFYSQYQDILSGMSMSDIAEAFGLSIDNLSQFGDSLDNVTELIDIFRLKSENTGKSVIDLGKDFNFLATDVGENLDKKLQDAGTSLEEYLNITEGKTGGTEGYIGDSRKILTGNIVDFSDVIKQLQALGATTEEAYGALDKMMDAGQIDALTESIQQADGSMLELGSSSEEFLNYWNESGITSKTQAWAQYVAEARDEAEAAIAAQTQTDILLEAFTKSLAGIGSEGVAVKFNVDGTDFDSVKEVIAEIQENHPTTITATYTDITNAADVFNGIVDKEITLTLTKAGDGWEIFTSGGDSASGYNNAHGFAGGKHSNGQYQGIAELGELGPELFIHNGQPYLAGVNGRVKAYVNPDDQIYTASQTREILNDNPSMQDIPGFSVGYNKVEWGSHASSSNAKTSKYDPERYHLITRQLKDLQREYERLDKIKENAYGTNKLEAIQAEVDATNELIEGQKALIQETEDYLAIDAGHLKELLEPGEFQVDENGNLLNFEELQEKYRRKAEEDKDEQAQDIWKALQQYEETIDKLQEANVEMQDLLYQEMELRLEKITTKAELKIDFDDREIKLLDHYIKRIDDNIYHTAEVLTLTEQKLGHINQKIEDTKEGINGLFTELSDNYGNKITKEDGSNYTLEDWLAMSKEQRDLLNINDNFGKQLEEYMDNILDYIEELEEFKTKGVEEFADAFSELNDNIRSSIDLFDHYNQLLGSLKNITQLQGIKLSAEMKAAMKEINAAIFNNTQNNIDAERENYRRLSSNVTDLRKKVAETTDETLKKQWEEQLKTAEDELRTSESNLLSLWETGLQQAKDMFESALQDAADEYEATISGMYGTVDELQKAWDQQKKNDEFYVKDYEKYYQISKLQRSITKDLDAAARAGNKQNQGLKKLYDELNDARKNGVELSAYDLDIFEKRYEYEKALMELEDARNNKSEVRLHRDANGNWGYVYTSSADEEDLVAKQQAVDDKFYELQKATQERVAALSDDMMSEITGVGQRLQELRSSGASQETIDKYLEQEKQYLDNYRLGLAKALEDAGMTEEEARLRYGNEGFDILNNFSETLLSSINGGNETLDEFFNKVGLAMNNTNDKMNDATNEYQNSMNEINKWFNESGEDLTKVIKDFASIIGEESSNNLIDSKEQIENARDTFTEILQIASDFEKEFMKIYQPIIDENEKLVKDLLYALHALNREVFEGPSYGNTGNNDMLDIINKAEATNSNSNSENSGSGSPYSPPFDGGEGDTAGGNNVEYTPWEYNETRHWRYLLDNNGMIMNRKVDYGPHQWIIIGGGTHKKCKICNYMVQITFDWDDNNNLHRSFASGGYTGAWGSEGRIAMLHEKELVLNKDDTEKFLNATNILRTIDLQTGLFSKGLGNIITPWISDLQSETLEQNVHIDATFPNVTDHNEIELAFDNLINKATQYANRKNMSAMTFQDSYLNKI